MDDVRFLKRHEMKQRGCEYCIDRITGLDESEKIRKGCIHTKCPYKVLDNYETYDDFLASEDSLIIVPEFFQTNADCYELAQVRDNPYHLYFEGISRRF